jgi:hypothetical protein
VAEREGDSQAPPIVLVLVLVLVLDGCVWGGARLASFRRSPSSLKASGSDDAPVEHKLDDEHEHD